MEGAPRKKNLWNKGKASSAHEAKIINSKYLEVASVPKKTFKTKQSITPNNMTSSIAKKSSKGIYSLLCLKTSAVNSATTSKGLTNWK